MASWKKLIAENSSGVASVSSKLGVGTSNPTSTVVMKGSNANQLHFDPANASIYSNTTGIYISGNNGNSALIVGHLSNTATPTLQANSGGNIGVLSNLGVGTAAPSFGKLQVNPGSSSTTGLAIWGANDGIKINRSSGGNDGAWGQITMTDNDWLHLKTYTESKGIGVDRIGGANSGINPANNYIQFSSYDKIFSRLGTTQMTMTASKVYFENVNVGIEETSPTHKLEVKGHVAITDGNNLFMKRDGSSLRFTSDGKSGGTNHGEYYMSADGTMNWTIGGTNRMSLTGNGPSVHNIYTPSVLAAGGDSLGLLASGVTVSIAADYDSNYGNVDIYPTGKNIGVAKTARFNPSFAYFYKPLNITTDVRNPFTITTSLTNTTAGVLSLKNQTTGNMVDNFGASLDFQIRDSAGVDNTIAKVAGIRDGADNQGGLVFHTASVGGTNTERMRINVLGNVGIGTTNPTQKLMLGAGNILVTGGGIGINISHSPDNPLHIENGSNGMASIRLEDARTGDTSIDAGGYLDFYANHHTTNKHLGRIQYSQSGTGHEEVAFKITGTLAGVGGKKLIMNDDNGVWKFYNNYTQDEAMIIKNSKVGIGTFSPLTTLHTKGSTGIRMESTNKDNAMALIAQGAWGASNGGDGGMQLMVLDSTGTSRSQYIMRRIKTAANGDTIGDYPFEWWMSNADGGMTQRMKLNRAGLGIGTNNPSALIHGTGTNGTTLRLKNTSSALNYIHLENSANTGNFIQTNAGSIALNADAYGSSGDVRLMTGNTIRMKVDSVGRVGIGTGSPNYKLDIIHDADEQFRVGRSGGKYVAIRDDVMQFTGMTGNGMRIQTSDNADIKFSSGTGDTIFDYAGAGGKVGIGTSSPSAKLDVAGDGNIDTKLWIGNTHTGGQTWASMSNKGNELVIDGGGDSGLTIVTGASNAGYITHNNYNDGDYQWIKFDAENAGMFFKAGGTDNVLTLKSAGVGIGTDSPSRKFHIAGSGTEVYGRISNSGANSYAGLEFVNDAGSYTVGIRNDDRFGVANHTSFGGGYALVLGGSSRISLSNNDSGTDNTVFGKEAGNSIASGGNYNTMLGRASGKLLTTGDQNVYVGTYAGLFNVTGGSNTAIGYNSQYGASGESHSNNTSVGSNSLEAITTGVNNVAIGVNSLKSLTSGGYNISIGTGAGNDLTSGLKNIFIGDEAGKQQTTGGGSVNIGHNVGRLDSSSANVIIGSLAFDASNNSSSASNVIIGFESARGINYISSEHNVIIGRGAGTGGGAQFTKNIAIGSYALDGTGTNTTTGQLAIGHEALTLVSSGLRNMAIGYQSGKAITTQNDNTFVGFQSGRATTGAGNTALGKYTMYEGAGADYNTAVGTNALQNVTNDNNTAVGYEAGTYLTSGHENTFVGSGAGRRIQTGDENVGIGYYALSGGVTGDANVGVGYGTLANLTSGVDNVAIGNEAGAAVETGSYNIFIGDHNIGTTGMNGHTIIGTPDTDKTNLLGKIALYSASNWAYYSHYAHRYSTSNYAVKQKNDGTTYLNAKDTKKVHLAVNDANKLTVSGDWVGIGTSSPTQKLDVSGGTVKADAIMYHGALNVTASRIYGNGANTYFDSAYQINFRSGATPAQAMIIKTDGKVGIGTTSPAEKLDVNGTFRATGAGNFTGNLTVDGDFEVGTTTQFYDNVTFNGVDVDLTQSSITGLNVSVTPTATNVFKSATNANNINFGSSTTVGNVTFAGGGVKNTTHITHTNNGSQVTLKTAGEYNISTNLVVTNDDSSDRFTAFSYIYHYNSGGTLLHKYGLEAIYIRGTGNNYNSGGMAGQIKLVVNANDYILVRVMVLDREGTGTIPLDAGYSDIRIDKITYSTT